MKIWKSIWSNAFVRNILSAIVVVVLLAMVVLWGLDFYTQHGKGVVVPDVKGLQEQEASVFFQKNRLRYEVVDSAYIKNARPGSVVEMTPKAGTKVKENRIVYITINAFSTETFVIPEVKDLSQRQALAMLKAIGFENINVEYVSGAYQDLVVGLQHRGNDVSAGDRLPINSRMTLKVSSGVAEIHLDTISEEANDSDDSWF